ncbi:MAG: pyridoxamine 5'-phosphate oxidase [Gammaproteobacteria bacterium]|nr:pyridoxamine 5'-phosphate oxidase [Gammaproteobacteria bacterium]
MRLLPETLPKSPLPLLNTWLKEAMQGVQSPNPNSMALATVSPEGKPSVRVVLCKELNVEKGYLVYYTNYRSAKAADIDCNPNAAISMHWDSKGRQVRVEGVLVKSPATESDAYFLSRDRDSRVGAWASAQSVPIPSRQALEEKFADAHKRFSGQDVKRPLHWGGYRLWFTSVELWISLESRLHDRARWERDVTICDVDSESAEIKVSNWQTIGRLQP